MSQSGISPLEAEELRFEYEQRRKELLANDTLVLQIFWAAVVATSAIGSLTISNAINSNTLKGVACFIAWLVVLMSIYQIIDREQSVFIIASYLRIFVESETTYMKWDTRLLEFRNEQKTGSKRQGFSLAISQLRTLSIILIGTLFLGVWYAWQDVSQSVSLLIALILWFLCTATLLGRLWVSPKGKDRYGIRDLTYFDETWEAVEKKEKDKEWELRYRRTRVIQRSLK